MSLTQKIDDKIDVLLDRITSSCSSTDVEKIASGVDTLLHARSRAFEIEYGDEDEEDEDGEDTPNENAGTNKDAASSDAASAEKKDASAAGGGEPPTPTPAA